ncbi:MAG TPA: L-serine ammonia-lyase, iron-sulfur-dependent, subunit alpha [Melioribacteraceae bacterium]|nr:L-serine ammonia-lyase, iron-sulfur-dependent, subunit alpha [Melioribacteraceae bacterium]
MESIKEIFRIGNGPSSSHTMGPKKAAEIFYGKNIDSEKFIVTLYGSLAATGKGHLTDVAIESVFGKDKTEIIWKANEFLPSHPNGMKFEAIKKQTIVNYETIYSVGGGKITDFKDTNIEYHPYKLNSMKEILEWIKQNSNSFWEYVEYSEGKEIYIYLKNVWSKMKKSVINGLDNEGTLPGGLNVKRKAGSYYVKAKNYTGSLKEKTLLFSYALAVAEENAGGGEIVTAPTCGSCGVLPAVLFRMQESFDFSDEKILRALATAGLIGNLVKTNASISGAEVGCQGEIGTACAMAGAAVTQLLGGTPYQIEYAAEMGMEHHLGLTCDPINGLVQVPCIERNAFAAERAFNTATFSLLSDGRHIVSFDKKNTASKYLVSS